MIYTLGCSFTKWHWPTWSDWLALYLDVPVTNLAYPGNSNSNIYYWLVSNQRNLGYRDTVHIMWSGSNRVCQWYDLDHVNKLDIMGFFPDTNGKLWHGTDQWRGLYKCHPDHLPSFTHMVVDNWRTITEAQRLLQSIGCDWTMSFWQNPWLDPRETFRPKYQTTWQSKASITNQELEEAQRIRELPVVDSMLKALELDRMIGITDLGELDQYYGLWEHTMADKYRLSFNHRSDHHPNTLAHHDWARTYLYHGDRDLRTQAVALALSFQTASLPQHDRSAEITGGTRTLWSG